jgi:uncharacterized protein YcfJ
MNAIKILGLLSAGTLLAAAVPAFAHPYGGYRYAPRTVVVERYRAPVVRHVYVRPAYRTHYAPRRAYAYGYAAPAYGYGYASPGYGYYNPAGAIGGAIIGGVIGNQFGHGSGRTAATIGGALIGGAIGSGVGYY